MREKGKKRENVDGGTGTDKGDQVFRDENTAISFGNRLLLASRNFGNGGKGKKEERKEGNKRETAPI